MIFFLAQLLLLFPAPPEMGWDLKLLDHQGTPHACAQVELILLPKGPTKSLGLSISKVKTITLRQSRVRYLLSRGRNVLLGRYRTDQLGKTRIAIPNPGKYNYKFLLRVKNNGAIHHIPLRQTSHALPRKRIEIEAGRLSLHTLPPVSCTLEIKPPHKGPLLLSGPGGLLLNIPPQPWHPVVFPAPFGGMGICHLPADMLGMALIELPPLPSGVWQLQAIPWQEDLPHTKVKPFLVQAPPTLLGRPVKTLFKEETNRLRVTSSALLPARLTARFHTHAGPAKHLAVRIFGTGKQQRKTMQLGHTSRIGRLPTWLLPPNTYHLEIYNKNLILGRQTLQLQPGRLQVINQRLATGGVKIRVARPDGSTILPTSQAIRISGQYSQPNIKPTRTQHVSFAVGPEGVVFIPLLPAGTVVSMVATPKRPLDIPKSHGDSCTVREGVTSELVLYLKWKD